MPPKSRDLAKNIDRSRTCLDSPAVTPFAGIRPFPLLVMTMCLPKPGGIARLDRLYLSGAGGPQRRASPWGNE